MLISIVAIRVKINRVIRNTERYRLTSFGVELRGGDFIHLIPWINTFRFLVLRNYFFQQQQNNKKSHPFQPSTPPMTNLFYRRNVQDSHTRNLLKRGYKRNFVTKQIQRAADITLQRKQTDKPKRIPFITTYNPSLPSIFNIIKKTLQSTSFF